MISMSGIRNALWCLVGFGIVACAARVELIVSNDEQSVPTRIAAGAP